MKPGLGRKKDPTAAGAPAPVVVHSITSAAQAHSDDLDARIRRYLISMGIRTVCVILVLVIHNPVRWGFAVLAVILPYIAVVMANAVDSRRGKGAPPVTAQEVRQVALTQSDHLDRSRPESDSSAEQSKKESHEWTS
jgi:type II secretory pathway component PulM